MAVLRVAGLYITFSEFEMVLCRIQTMDIYKEKHVNVDTYNFSYSRIAFCWKNILSIVKNNKYFSINFHYNRFFHEIIQRALILCNENFLIAYHSSSWNTNKKKKTLFILLCHNLYKFYWQINSNSFYYAYFIS